MVRVQKQTAIVTRSPRGRRAALGALLVLAAALEGAYGCVGEADTEDFIEENVGEVSQAIGDTVVDGQTASVDTYSMWPSVPPSACPSSWGGMGCHAAKWKSLNMSVPVNTGGAACDSIWASCLNNQESNPSIFPNGDPAGKWSDFTAFSAGELAVGAAFAMWHWKTPVYFALNWYDIDGDGWQDTYRVAIEQVTFNISDPWGAKTLHDLCEWLGFENNQSSQGSVASSCSFHESADFTLSSVRLVYWNQSGYQTKTVSGSQFATMASGSTFYVSDPPEGVDPAAMARAVRATWGGVRGRFGVATPEGTRRTWREVEEQDRARREPGSAPRERIVEDPADSVDPPAFDGIDPFEAEDVGAE